MARLTPGNEENKARRCFRPEKPYLPLPIDADDSVAHIGSTVRKEHLNWKMDHFGIKM